jgi:ubiquinone/menaquinone biosynthesis C-methylase UbiE
METLKNLVQEKYSQIAKQSKTENETSCCGSCGCDTVDYVVMADDYSALHGYNQDADLGLGCGLPTQFAHIKEGDTVVDLGSGAGNDCFVARSETGATGQVIGVDFTEAMLEKATQNAKKLGFENVTFVYGDLEQIPLVAETANVVVSNCVFNLVPNKEKAFSETFRILKNGGHFSISDIVLEGDLPEGLQKDAEMYAGCVSGAIQKQDYLDIIQNAGFQDITIQKQKPITIPDEILRKYLSDIEILNFNKKQGIYSITVFAKKMV